MALSVKENHSLSLTSTKTPVSENALEISQDPFTDIHHKIREAFDRGKNIMLMAPGGTGKSYILRRLGLYGLSQGRNVFMTATTGVAALELSSPKMKAKTLHSFSGVGIGRGTAKDLLGYVCSRPGNVKRWRAVTDLCIDEISMLGLKLFEKLNYIAQRLRKNSEPFGGIRLILSGDFMQLPPVDDNWLFESDVYDELNLECFFFSKPKRFVDKKFADLLLRIRMGKQTQGDLDILKERVDAYNEWKKIDDALPDDAIRIKPTVLYSKRVDVAVENQIELDKLTTKAVTFKAEDVYKVPSKKLKHEKMLEDMAPSVIVLKVGAQVMLTFNVCTEEGLVNGSRGVIEKIKESYVSVKFLHGTFDIERVSFEIVTRMKTKAARRQFPLMIAYAGTIHKFQGKTLDYAIIDLGPSLFLGGQAYVALSRLRTLEGLFITDLFPEGIRPDKKALTYVTSME